MTDADALEPYRGATVVFATRHGKERQAVAPFRELLDARVVAPEDIDTDRFGTFTGDVPRTGTPWRTALDKARLGVELTGVPLALASEASYGGAWWAGMHHELLLFHDGTRGITLTEEASGASADPGARVVGSVDEALAAAARFGFPGVHAVAVAGDAPRVVARKGLADPDALAAAVEELLGTGGGPERGGAPVRVGPDHRAHADPPRQRVIAGLCRRMAERLTRPCPDCRMPGWGLVDVERGLPCGLCGTPTAAVAADVHGCGACGATRAVPRAERAVDPRWCDACNP
ncbi:DUF6671 family protein [Clavibacter nebraskensis]|uniref:DUF6671 domain-containing protein n=3 Tax=Clavibacter nebraskensis TaxID=31963 RepID=A0AAI9EHQ7_9MICO|nr:DUF6671 family protein [Clavibacter nebraskensis]KXU21878.1 hypothetical protein VV38_00635 [Clavibacter nebraskensis]OAH18866.1 hypothetical protein A3Q38_10605 [Clavibacter nebraskensis]QGV65556.1 hypothetical protein EGX36_00970 [Clavibacter nebraskensis]QGV68354.1 hypothetical protein EGX37_00970 [Clavibacter nebraskensis]QGV71145.1 hypothetical protein EGX35_00970 [Clavibacter nebraskensis]